MSKNDTKTKLPTEAELVQAIRIAKNGPSNIGILCDMLDALREGRLEINKYDGWMPRYESTPYKHVKIRKE